MSSETQSFRIYVAGDTHRTQRAVSNLRGVCESSLGDRFEIEVVDVLEQPELAEQERVVATPTVDRLSPAPARRVIGDLSDFRLAASALGLSNGQGPDTRGDPS